MNDIQKPSHVMVNPDAWQFDDPVVFWAVFTVLFAVVMVIFALRKAMKLAEEEREQKEKGGTNS